MRQAFSDIFWPSHRTWKMPHICTSVRRCLCPFGSTCLMIRRPAFQDFFGPRTTTVHSPPTSSTAWARSPLCFPGETVPLHRKVRNLWFSPLMTLVGLGYLGPPFVVRDLCWGVSGLGWDTTGPEFPTSTRSQVCYSCCKRAAPRLCALSPLHQASASHGFEAWGWTDAEQSLLLFGSIPKHLNFLQIMC